MPFDSTTPADLAQFVAYVCTDQGAAAARAVLERSFGDGDTVHDGGLSGAARICNDIPEAHIITPALRCDDMRRYRLIIRRRLP